MLEISNDINTRSDFNEIKDFVIDKALEPAFSSIWRNEATAEDALKQAVQTAQPFLQGRWDQ